MGYWQEEDEKYLTQYKQAIGHYQINLGFSNTWALPQAHCLHAMLP